VARPGERQELRPGDLSVRLVGGLFVTASGEAGRQPPRYEPSGRFGLGLGFRLGPS